MRASSAAAAALAGLAAAGLGAGCLSRPSFECEIALVFDQTYARIGNNGGIPRQSTTCGERAVVGVGLSMSSDVNAMYRQRTAVTAWLRCATMANHDGEYAAGGTEDVAAPGGGRTEVDAPVFADCPRGQIVVGLAAHIVGQGGLFNSLSIQCAALDPMGVPVGQGQADRIPLIATGSEPINAEAKCNAGDAAHGFRPYTGSELDQLELICGRASCALAP